jgi:hypothetical protein
VKLGAETPHTSGLAEDRIVKRLAEEPLAELRTRVASLRVARGAVGSPKPPVTASKTVQVNGSAVELSDRDLEICKQTGCKPEVYAALKAQRPAV